MIGHMLAKHVPFLLLLLLYFTLGVGYVFVTPDWQAPDEPAHYNYVRQLASGEWPRIETGDYDQAYQETIISKAFDPQYSIAAIEYEDYQPPLYYLALTPSYWLSNGQLEALRLTSVVMGAGIVGLCYGIGRKRFPDQPAVALTAAAFVGLLPQHLAILSSVNNDALAWLLIATMLYVVLDEPLRHGRLALLLGLAFLTKVTAYLMAPAIGLWLLWRFRHDWRAMWSHALRIFVPALLIGSIWWLYNVIAYPGLDFLGTQAHDAVVVGQTTTGEFIETAGGLDVWLGRLFFWTFNSFWGQFGWMAAPFPSWIYALLWLFFALVLLGFILARRKGEHAADTVQWRLVAALLLLFNLGLYLAYNAKFVQTQGRYLFASLLPIGFAVASGSHFWAEALLPKHRALRLAWLIPLGVAGFLSLLSVYALRFMLPCLSYANLAC